MTKWQLFRAWAEFSVSKSDYSIQEVKDIEAVIDLCLKGKFEEACVRMLAENWMYLNGTPLLSKRRAHQVYNSIRTFARNSGRIAVSGSYSTPTEKLAWELLSNKVHVSDLIGAVAKILDEAVEPEVVLKSFDVSIPKVVRQLQALSTIAKDIY